MLAAVGVVWLFLLSVAMLALTPFVLADGRPVDAVLTGIFAVLAVLTAGFLAAGARRMLPVGRPGLWAGVGGEA